MSWRTIVISSRCKLDLKMGYMVVRTNETKRIYLDEISTLIIENNTVSFTGCLLEALCNKKINVIFCDSKRNPMSELSPLYGSHDCSRKVREQSAWQSPLKSIIWTEIVAEKIRNQAALLNLTNKHDSADLLLKYVAELQCGDITNREGHAAKVYFNSLFGTDFTRDFDCHINSALNYGYSILLSAFNREVYTNGYITHLGLHHNNTFNKFNLSSDLMEPFRIVIDKHVYYSQYNSFEREDKYDILNLFNETFVINNTHQTLWNAIKIYTKSVFDAIEEKNPSLIKFIKI